MTLKLDASFVIKTIEARGEGKTMRTLISDDILLDKYDKRQVERAGHFSQNYILLDKYDKRQVERAGHFSQNYSLLMQFTTCAVQTVQAVKLVMAELE